MPLDEQKEYIRDAVITAVNDVLPGAIEKTVNGKINNLTTLVKDHNKKHEEDMTDIRPIIQEYKERQAVQNFASVWTGRIRAIASTITALGIIGALLFWASSHIKP